ncbi:U4/U6.U5 tri-snRNP-associated protein 3 [Purpureocillium lavendulum]|uniref:U4/U6.U5 tri-snRNP-associated protein 3 n=1 Tax=Purpureocillium lavendulum TaxID=1247861 RepID=A0AB34FFT6_9HYPO|nr:U4/U6.U5 tri-snRNP-associated protein 3 [Purpureocillium lavendulum]
MSDSRRGRRPNSHQMWDDAERDRQPPRDAARDRDRDPRDRRGYRSRSRDRSPDRRYNRGRDTPDRGRDGRGRGRGGGRGRGRGQYDDRDRRDHDRRDDYYDRDDRYQRRRSASPQGASPPPGSSTTDLPTRAREPKPEPRSPRPARHGDRSPRRRDASREADDARGRQRIKTDAMDVEEGGDEEGEELDPDAAAMQAMLGFGGFGTTKGKKIAGNDVGGVRKEKKSEYRQYMNRQGGFNRPLSPSR